MVKPGERRKDLRLGILEPFRVRFEIKKQKGVFGLRTQKVSSASNMSTGGMCLELPTLDQKEINRIMQGQDKLILEFSIPYLRKPLRITGKVTWVEKKDIHGKPVYVAGVSFENVKEKDRENILLELINLCLDGKANIILE